MTLSMEVAHGFLTGKAAADSRARALLSSVTICRSCYPMRTVRSVPYAFCCLLCLNALHVAVPAHAQWTDGQSAFRVLGQPDFTSSTFNNGGISASTFFNPEGICLDLTNGKMYVVDSSNNRVLRFAYPTTGDQQAAEAVLGQANFTSTTASLTASSMNDPRDCAVSSTGTLFVSDQDYNRVLRFDSAHNKSSGADADGVLGVSTFTTANGGSRSASTLVSASNLALDGNTLYVSTESRVLRFNNAASKSNGANADGVLGQSSFTTSVGARTQSGMDSPAGLAVDDSGTLYVADIGNSRILRFDNAASKSNGANADGVLGPSDFTSYVGTTSQSGMNLPEDVIVDGAGRLYVMDWRNNRILYFDNASAKANGANADGVLGQSDFTSSSSGTTASTLNLGAVSGLAVDPTNNRLWAADGGNNRVLGYQASSSLPIELTSFSALLDTDRVRLTWETASETNNAGFELQHQTTTALDWHRAAFVEGYGTTLEAQTYAHTLTNLGPGTHRFRLKQIDYDGTFSYSPTTEVFVPLPSAFEVAAAYPNPFTSETQVHLMLQQVEHVRITIYDALGRTITTLHDGTLAGQQAHVFRFESAGHPSGLYLLEVQGERSRSYQSLLLAH